MKPWTSSSATPAASPSTSRSAGRSRAPWPRAAEARGGLPSIRALARDLRISVITTKRAYEELERDGYIYTVAGKGCFVSEQDLELQKEAGLREIEEHLQAAVDLGRQCGLTLEDLDNMLRVLSEEE